MGRLPHPLVAWVAGVQVVVRAVGATLRETLPEAGVATIAVLGPPATVTAVVGILSPGSGAQFGVLVVSTVVWAVVAIAPYRIGHAELVGDRDAE